MKTITITNQKGGVGKTTTAHVLATGLLKRGFKVLVIDTDPQTNLTFTAGIDPLKEESTLYNVFKGEVLSSDAVVTSDVGFDMIPGSLELAGADMEFTQAGREYMLKEALDPIQEHYDYCVIDTPPNIGILTINSLTASNKVVVPMGADVYSLQGLSQLQKLIEQVKKYCNSSLVIEGLLLTKYSPRAIINRQLKETLEKVSETLNTKVFKSYIREAVAIKEIQFSQSNIFVEYPDANVTKDYDCFIDELLEEGK